MRIWHAIVGVLIFSAIILGFTNYGAGGLLYDMKYKSDGTTSYNSAINESYFSKYDYADDAMSSTKQITENSTGGRYGDDLDTEQTALATLWDGAKVASQGFSSSKEVIKTTTEELGIATYLIVILMAIVALWVAFKTVEFIFGR